VGVVDPPAPVLALRRHGVGGGAVQAQVDPLSVPVVQARPPRLAAEENAAPKSPHAGKNIAG
jgi:hypothetical protein